MSDVIVLRSPDGHEFDVFEVLPLGAAKGTIVVIQEIFGVNAHIREVAQGFAEQGYRALAPALFDRVERQVALGYSGADMMQGVELARGKLRPEGRIDLHGMTMAQAHPALQDFILGSAQLQRRLVLVITGKGKSKPDHGPIPERHGVLRHNVPIWLRQSPLSLVILEVTQAHQRHGGEGALYVYLRRGR